MPALRVTITPTQRLPSVMNTRPDLPPSATMPAFTDIKDGLILFVKEARIKSTLIRMMMCRVFFVRATPDFAISFVIAAEF